MAMGADEFYATKNSRKAYEDAIKNKHIVDKSGPIPEGVGAEALTEASSSSSNIGAGIGSSMAQTGAQSGNVAQTIGGAAMMSGNPYLMAGGLGLSVLAAGEQNKRNQEEAQRQAYNERIKERQILMSQIAQNNRIA